MRKVEFYCRTGSGEMDKFTETYEFKKNVSDKEIENRYYEWFFETLDMNGIEGSWEEIDDDK